jgi:hypothetical protein
MQKHSSESLVAAVKGVRVVVAITAVSKRTAPDQGEPSCFDRYYYSLTLSSSDIGLAARLQK